MIKYVFVFTYKTDLDALESERTLKIGKQQTWSKVYFGLEQLN